MNFGSGGATAKAWRDIWGSGQGIGAVKAVTPVANSSRGSARIFGCEGESGGAGVMSGMAPMSARVLPYSNICVTYVHA